MGAHYDPQKSSSIALIPTELLTSIFELALPQYSPPVRRSLPLFSPEVINQVERAENAPPRQVHFTTLLALTSTCQQWRHAAISDPNLWRTIICVAQKSDDFLQRAEDRMTAHIKRSKAVSLNVIYHVAYHETSWGHLFAKIIHPELYRCQSLQLVVDVLQLECLLPFPTRLPAMERFLLGCNRPRNSPRYEKEVIIFDIDHQIRLQQLHITSFLSAGFGNLELDSSQMRALHIDFFRHNLNLSGIIKLLAKASMLESLVLSDAAFRSAIDSPPPSIDAIELPCLQSLACICIIAYAINAPNLLSLHLAIKFDLSEYHQARFPKLQHLTFSFLFPSIRELVPRLLESFPTLLDLRLLKWWSEHVQEVLDSLLTSSVPPSITEVLISLIEARPRLCCVQTFGIFEGSLVDKKLVARLEEQFTRLRPPGSDENTPNVDALAARNAGEDNSIWRKVSLTAIHIENEVLWLKNEPPCIGWGPEQATGMAITSAMMLEYT
ncbi:hypothetical protein DL93DRAFT_2184617 [Clavulina sp. PMI_390]|nr:hypothetical protein DL93DRAFT_2184617 [Clavulina sp. PMI_390]